MTNFISYTANNLSCVRQQQPLFANLSFSLKEGDALFIHGPNGVGKSSLLRILTGIATPECGEVRWQNKPIHSDREAFFENVHFIGHLNGLKLGLSILENLELAGKIGGTGTPFNLDEVLNILKLTEKADSPVRFLSAGQRRRVALARLLLYPKKLWILDEPMTSLDANTHDIVLRYMEQHLEQGGMIIASSHQTIGINRKIKILRLPS